MENNEQHPPMLFPYNPTAFWLELRKVIKEEIAKGQEASQSTSQDEPFMQRKEVARLLCISLVTLNDWVKRGLPSHKQRGKVYFLYSEVCAYIKLSARNSSAKE